MLKQKPSSALHFVIDLMKYLFIGNVLFFILQALLTLPVQGLRGYLWSSYPQLFYYASAVSIIVFIFSRFDQRTVKLPMPTGTSFSDLIKELQTRNYAILEEAPHKVALQSRSLYKKINYLGENILTLHNQDRQISVAGVAADIRMVCRILIRMDSAGS